MLRLRTYSLQRVSDWLLSSNSITIGSSKITTHTTGAAAPAMLSQLRQRQTVAPLSPLDRVKSRVQQDQHTDDAQHASNTTEDHGSNLAAQDPQGARRFPAAEVAKAADNARSMFQSQLAAPLGDAATASARQHWLDKHFPRARPWLQRKNIQWWLRGVQARCK